MNIRFNSSVLTCIKRFVLLLCFWALNACSNDNAEQQEKVSGRWYSTQQVEQGEKLYSEYCIACHGVNARGSTSEWKQPLADGSYPPPPLNGTAHTWHHSKKALTYTINNGGLEIGGENTWI